MHLVTKFVRALMLVNQWLAQLTLTFMFVSVTLFAVFRAVGHPIIGSIELAQLSMVLLIVGSLGYAELTNSHISIGLIVDRLPQKIQRIVDIIARLLTLIYCILVSAIMLISMNYVITSDLLHIPFYPFRYAIVLGFIVWGIVVMYKIFNSEKQLTYNRNGGEDVY